MKYNEDEILAEILEYIKGSYSNHYAKDGGMNAIDVWEAMGTGETTCRDTAIKYLMRYGEKEGFNRMDLIKCIHYVVVILGMSDKKLPDINN